MAKNKNINLIFTGIVSSLALFFSCTSSQENKSTNSNIPFPLPLADSAATVFLPGVVSSDSTDFGGTFSPDGKSFYFARSLNKKSKIYVTRYDGKTWTDAVPVAFTASNYAEADPCFAPDGRLYFISNRPIDSKDTTDDYNIWNVTLLPDSTWSEALNVEEVNSDSNEYYVSFSENENLYFASSRAGGFGEEDIYVSKKADQGKYATPENLGPTINTLKSEYDPAISPKEDLLIFTSSRRGDSFGGADLYYSKNNSAKTWLESIHLNEKINTKSREYCPYFSPDGKFFFFTSEGDVKWIKLDALEQQMENVDSK
jgi:Tol biopolymer transport system component